MTQENGRRRKIEEKEGDLRNDTKHLVKEC